MRLKKGRYGILGIIVAAVLIEVTAGAMYYTSQRIIQSTMEQLVKTEMNTIYLRVRNQLMPVEVTIYNEAWVISDYLNEPEDIYNITQNQVKHNPSFIGSGVAFIPDYYPQRARYFEPYSARQADGSIQTMQLGADGVDHTGDDYFRVPIETGELHWSEPYMDSDGAHAVVTTFGVPVLDEQGNRIAVAYADVALDWLDEVIQEATPYRSTQRFIVSGKGSLLAGTDNPIYRAALVLVQANEDREGYSVLTDGEGIKRHVFYHPIGGYTDWVLINVLDDDEVFGTLKEVRLILWILLLIGLCVMGFLLWRALRNTEELQRINTEKARVDTELKVANAIQYALLPRRELHKDNLVLKGYLKPAREVGGDLYDYRLVGDTLWFFIGDVSGKGVPAAMFMSATVNLFRAAGRHTHSPKQLMEEINAVLSENNPSLIFVTALIGRIDLITGEVRYSNAGHCAPLVAKSTDHFTDRVQSTDLLACTPNIPLGYNGRFEYEEQTMVLHAGEQLVLYTDGITEARNEQREFFGQKRLAEVVAQGGDVLQAVRQFMGNAEQTDDITLLKICRLKSN